MKDRYRLVGRVGVGGSSVVWRAHDEVLRRDVAIKVPSSAAARQPAVVDRIRQEARAAAGLRHPSIVDVYDYGEESGEYGSAPTPYVVMELVEGRSLSEVLNGGSLPWRDAVRICAQVASALAAAHKQGLVHRDVKPGNVMVTADGVKLVDFGISAYAGAPDEVDGEVLGTPAYLAPERLDGGPVRTASDVYGLGLLLYRMLAGGMPWQASTITEMVRAHLRSEPEPLPALPGLPRAVRDLVLRCLSKDPGARPAAAEVAWILDDVAGVLRKPRRLHFPTTRSTARTTKTTKTTKTNTVAATTARPAEPARAAKTPKLTAGTTPTRTVGAGTRPATKTGTGRRRPKIAAEKVESVRRLMGTAVAALTLGAVLLLR